MTEQNSICILCGRQVDPETAKQSCSFHPGKPTVVFSTGAMTTRGDVDMGYRDIYNWSCCGKREPSLLVKSVEYPPRKYPGCKTHSRHRINASARIIFAKKWEGFCRASESALAQRGIRAEFVDVDECLAKSDFYPDCNAFVLGDENHERAMELADSFRNADSKLPILIFSDPRKVDAWRLQATSSDRLTEDQLATGIFEAVRSRYSHDDSWNPWIFFSYSRVDDIKMRDWIHDLSQERRACWVDKHILAPGIDWSSEIERGIEKSDLFVLLLTEKTPPTTYCWKELSLARSLKKPVFVIAYDEAEHRFLQLHTEKDRKLAHHMVSYDMPTSRSDARQLLASADVSPPNTTIFQIKTGDDTIEWQRWVRFFLQKWPQTWQPAASNRWSFSLWR